jgi:hypothetical protein
MVIYNCRTIRSKWHISEDDRHHQLGQQCIKPYICNTVTIDECKDMREMCIATGMAARDRHTLNILFRLRPSPLNHAILDVRQDEWFNNQINSHHRLRLFNNWALVRPSRRRYYYYNCQRAELEWYWWAYSLYCPHTDHEWYWWAYSLDSPHADIALSIWKSITGYMYHLSTHMLSWFLRIRVGHLEPGDKLFIADHLKWFHINVS